MKIRISPKRADDLAHYLAMGGIVVLGNLAELRLQRMPDKRAYHNFSGKRRVIRGYAFITGKPIGKMYKVVKQPKLL